MERKLIEMILLRNLLDDGSGLKSGFSLLSVGILIERLALGGMMLAAHGFPKLKNFDQLTTQFPDPLGLGSFTSLLLAISAEVFCSILVILGLGTRVAAVPLVITMLVASVIVHADDPWQRKEFALLYLIPFLSMIFTGAGRYSIDHLLSREIDRKRTGNS
jgi:putative oxidoreductase